MKRIIYTLACLLLTVGAWAQNVAKIGSTEYATLAEAIGAVPTDGTATTITMLSDVDLTAALTIANTQNIVLDLNGKTVKNDASKSLSQLITVNGKLTIDDSSAEKDGVIKNTASGKYVIKTGTAASVLTLNNGTIQTTTGNSNGAVYCTYGSFVMTGGKVIAAGTGVTSKNVTISGGEITATAGQALCAAGTISGGTFTSANNNAVYANQSGTLEITGGTFTGVSTKPTVNLYSTDVKVTGVTLSNGIGFASNATAMLLPGTDETYLEATHAEYYDGETLVGYAPINTGLLANGKVSGKTVKLTKDVATTTYLNVTKSFTLDLNGHNIACTPAKADAAILTKGTASAPVELTIKGDGKISCGDHGEGCNAIQVSNYSTVNIEGGEYSVPGDNSTIYMLATSGSSVVNISGGTFESGDGKYVLNIKDDVRDHNSFNVTGGTYVGFNPEDNIAEGEGTNFVADDYKAVIDADGNYSVVERTYVAKIGDKGYETLAEAIDAVPTDGTATTITMLSDVDLTAALTIANTKNIVLDLNGKTIKNDASKSLAQLITVNGQLTIDDSSAEKDGVIKNTASGKYVVKTGTAASVLTLNNGTIQTTTGNSNGAVYCTNGSFVMTGGKVIAAGTGVTSKNVTISGGEITATAGQALCAAGTITGGTFTSTNNNAVYANQSGTLEITGGTFTGVSTKPTINLYTTDVKVTGATLSNGIGFASNATAMILPGTDSEYLDATQAEYYDGETLVGYAPINTGLLANGKVSGKTVKLTKDVATTTYLNVTKSFTLDLNGHNIACTPAKADAAILTKGTTSAPVELTIKGDGKISCSDHGEGCNAIQVGNYSTLNIEGGEYSVPGDNSTIYMLATSGSSVVNISGGTFESGDGKYVLNIKDDTRDHNSFNVIGGTYVGFNPEDNNAEGEGTNFVADGYKAIDNGDGTFTVVERTYIAQIGDVLYESLDEAIEDAQDGETIILLDDAETTKETLPANVTIDANGKELTMPIFEVIDGEPINYPNITGTETYKVRKALYKRINISTTEWGTVCLPFTLTSGNGADYYIYNNISGDKLFVDETSESIEPNKPVVFNKTTEALNIIEENATVSLVAPAEMVSGALIGTYESIDIPADGSIYYINSDKFHKTQVSLKVPAYRAYIKYTDGGAAAPRTISIFVGGEDDATAIGSLTSEDAGIDAIYDASGRKMTATQKGINIVKLTNGKAVKIFVK